MEGHRNVRNVGVRRAGLDVDRHAPEPQEGAARRRRGGDPAWTRRIPPRRVRRSNPLRSRAAVGRRQRPIPRRRGRHVSERPVGDEAPLERRPDGLRAQPDAPGAAQGSHGDLPMTKPVVACLLAAVSSGALGQSYQRTETGIVVAPAAGPAVRLQVYGDGIIRVTEVPVPEFNLPASLMVRAKPLAAGFAVSDAPGMVTLSTGNSSADVELATGLVRFRDSTGRVVLAESGPPSFAPANAEGRPWLAISQQFNRGTDEGFYGLGQHQNGQMNYNGEDVLLSQHNMDVAIPFLVSTRNYGLLWDNDSVTRFGDPEPYTYAGAPDDGLEVNGGRGWDATYSVKGKTLARRSEPTIQLEYLEDVNRWPAGTRKPDMQSTVDGLHVTWEGTVVPKTGGLHRFRLYGSSYFKVFVDGREVLDRWRQNWNPFYHNFDVELAAGTPHKVRVEWDPDSGYIALLHADPRPEQDRHSLTLSSE